MDLDLDGLARLETLLREAREMKVGTIRDWSKGKVVKTPQGWQPWGAVAKAAGHAPRKAHMTVQGAKIEGPAGVITAQEIPGTARKTQKFSAQGAVGDFRLFAKHPLDTDSQRKVRGHMNALCSDFGMLDRDQGRPRAERIKVLSKEKMAVLSGGRGCNGLHDWDGTIVVRDKAVDRSLQMLEGVAAGKTPGDSGPKAAKGMHVLVHESVHGHSPIRQEQFKGRYRLLEEATTEMAARKVMHDTFGIPWSQFAESTEEGEKLGAYGEFCRSLHQGTKAALTRLGVSVEPPTLWYDLIGEAAVEMRRRPPPTDPDKATYLARFADSLPLPEDTLAAIGGREAVAQAVSEAVWLSLKPAREREKLWILRGKGASADLIDQQELSVALHEKEWDLYLSGAKTEESTAEKAGDALVEAAGADADEGMLPRNNLRLATAVAVEKAKAGSLTEGDLRDLALLQARAGDALIKITGALAGAGLALSKEPPWAGDGIVF